MLRNNISKLIERKLANVMEQNVQINRKKFGILI